MTFGTSGANASTGDAATFSGNGHIDIPWSEALNPGVQAPDGSGSFTVALWVRPTVVGGAHRSPFTSREDNGASVNGPIIYIAPERPVGILGRQQRPVRRLEPDPAAALSPDVDPHRHHDSATPRGRCSSMARRPLAWSAASLPTSCALHIGSGQDDGNNFFWAGRIDEVGFWNTALSQTEMQSVIANGVPEPALSALLGLSGTFLLGRRRR